MRKTNYTNIIRFWERITSHQFKFYKIINVPKDQKNENETETKQKFDHESHLIFQNSICVLFHFIFWTWHILKLRVWGSDSVVEHLLSMHRPWVQSSPLKNSKKKIDTFIDTFVICYMGLAALNFCIKCFLLEYKDYTVCELQDFVW
jgi:hypothetical protein